MQNTELAWEERTSPVAAIASVWTCKASEMVPRTVLADPCISLILVKSTDSTEVLIRGPETKPRDEILIPGYTWTAIRLQPGVRIKGFSVQTLTNRFVTLSTNSNAYFTIADVRLKFPAFDHVETLIEQMQQRGLISGKALDTKEHSQPGISPKSYSRLVKRNTGLSPYKLHQLQRIHEALHLIKQGVSATTVAADLGFVDQAHLNRAARQFLGHTPKELFNIPQTPKKGAL